MLAVKRLNGIFFSPLFCPCHLFHLRGSQKSIFPFKNTHNERKIPLFTALHCIILKTTGKQNMLLQLSHLCCVFLCWSTWLPLIWNANICPLLSSFAHTKLLLEYIEREGMIQRACFIVLYVMHLNLQLGKYFPRALKLDLFVLESLLLLRF